MSRTRQAVRAAAEFVQAHRRALIVGTVLLLACLGFLALHRMIAEVHWRQLRHAIHAIPDWRLAAALGLTCVSYLLLTLYDVIALRIVGRPLPYRSAALASFASYTLSHNLGLGLLTGGSARYRVYSAKGLTTREIVEVIATASVTFWLGVFAVTAALLAVRTGPLAIDGIGISQTVLRASGIAALAVILGVMLAAPRSAQPVRLFGWSVPLPGRGQALAQLAIAGLDLTAASAALFLLVPGLGPEAYPAFFLAYAVAVVAALISHVPGGAGVFEAVILAAAPEGDKAALLAALVAYRAIYYLLPLAVAAILLAATEHRQWKRPAAIALDSTRAIVSSLAPIAMSTVTFFGGVLLLVSGALPALPHRLHILRAILPLPFAEASHIAASMSGTALLLIAPGLYNRQDAAFWLARLLLIAGAGFSLMKGIDYEEAIVLLAIAGLLQWTRHMFYRRTTFSSQIFSPSWLAVVSVVLGLSLWVGLFVYRHVGYQNELWWQFAWHGDAPRFLRAAFATAMLVIAVAILHLSKSSGTGGEAGPNEPPAIEPSLAGCDRTNAMLAWTGDKLFLTSPDGSAFLMYRVQGRSWIVMGDPVGPKERWPDLLWRLRELADRAHGRLLLYQIGTDTLPLAIDLGLQLVKYGEEARVDLTNFTLEGPEARTLRYSERRAAREGAEFAVVPAAEVPALLPRLREISDEWMRAKGHSEKAFSVGRFSSAYLTRFDCAVVRCQGRIVAFANIWATDNREELSVDLMRHVTDAPYGTMDFLFVKLMEWGKREGYRAFSLGLAPLSGIEARRLAPIWAQIGSFLYRHGEALYGFEGLRAYKAKFSPLWEPRYIAGPYGVGLVRALLDLQVLIGGGRRSAARQATLSLVA